MWWQEYALDSPSLKIPYGNLKVSSSLNLHVMENSQLLGFQGTLVKKYLYFITEYLNRLNIQTWDMSHYSLHLSVEVAFFLLNVGFWSQALFRYDRRGNSGTIAQLTRRIPVLAASFMRNVGSLTDAFIEKFGRETATSSIWFTYLGWLLLGW